MSRDWSPTLVSELSSSEVGRCFLIKLVSPIKGTVLMTDADIDKTVSTETFVKSPGFTVTKWTVANGGRPAGVDITLPFDDIGPLLADDIKRGAWRGAAITCWVTRSADPSDREIIVDGFVGTTDFTDRITGSIEITTKADAMADIFLFTIQPMCPLQYGSVECGSTPRTVSAIVATVTDSGKFTVTVTNPDNLDFTHGTVVFTSGANDGYEDWTRNWTSGTSLIELVNGTPYDIAVGDALTLSEGCDQTRSGARGCTFHNNKNRFAGFDKTPAETQAAV